MKTMYLAAALTLLLGGAATAASPVNVLLIVSEDNGPELGCYGDPYAQTPHLDRLAEEGVRFERAFVPYSVCSPSRAVFLTGLFPHQNGQVGLATHKFAMYRPAPPNIVTLLRAAGYQTGLIGKLHVNPESDFPFDFRAIKGANFNRQQSIDAYAAAAAEFLADCRDRPFFLSVNFPDAHLPFLRQVNGRPSAPLSASDVQPMHWMGVDSPRIRGQVANYYNCLARLDEGVGRLLDTLARSGHADDTMVVYLGDHGAQFPRGKGTVYEGGLRIPLIVRWPGQTRAGTVRRELVSTIDILPTVLAAADLPVPSSLPGRGLQPLFGNTVAPKWRTYNFGFTTGSFPRACFVQHAVRGDRFKLISSPRPGTPNLDAGTYLDEQHPHYVVSGATATEQAAAPARVREAFQRWSLPPRYELYDLEQDPGEWQNLADDPTYAAEKRRLIQALTDWQQRTADPFRVQQHVDDFVAEQLANRDLQYRKRPGFAWSYLEQFARWRAVQQANRPRNPTARP